MEELERVLAFVDKINNEEDLVETAEPTEVKRQRSSNRGNKFSGTHKDDLMQYSSSSTSLVEHTVVRKNYVQKNYKKSSFAEFKRLCIFSPLQNIKDLPNRKFSPCISCDNSMIEKINRAFDHYCNAFFRQWIKGPGRPPSDMKIGSIVPLHDCMHKDAWKLFSGLEKSEEAYTYEDLEQIIFPEDFKEQKKAYKKNFLGMHKQKVLKVDNVDWVVTNRYDLPDITPIKYQWYNSKALKPSDKPFTDEKILMGRIKNGNETLYKKHENYKRIIPLLCSLDQVLAPLDQEEYCLMWRWFTGKFLCYRPCHTLTVMPILNLGYCLFLTFPKDSILETDDIYVPKWVSIASFAGEVRPNNFRKEDCYSTVLNEDPATQKQKGLVTLVVNPLAEDRPGFGSVGYMANHTCLEEAYFFMYRNEYGLKEGNGACDKANHIFQIDMLKARKDITGRNIIRLSNKFRESLKHKSINSPLDHDKHYFPVEFHYFGSRQVKEEHNDPYDSNGIVLCSCLTHCFYLPPRMRTKVPLINKPLEPGLLQKLKDKTPCSRRDKANVEIYEEQFG